MKKAILLLCTFLFCLSAVSVDKLSAIYDDGHLYACNNRLRGNTTVNYYDDASMYGSNAYDGYMDWAITSWYYPKSNGNGANCTPYNNVYHQYTGWSDSEMDVYASYEGNIGYYAYTQFFVYGNRAVNPDSEAYDYTNIVFNKSTMDRWASHGNVSKTATAAHEFGHVLAIYENNKSGTVMAQSSYRTVSGPSCTDNNSLNKRY